MDQLDCIEALLSFDQADELFALPSLPSFDLSVPQPPSKTDSNLPPKPKNGRRRKCPNSTSDEGNPTDPKKKKIIHRDVERQRRQEMSTLHSTLRSLLPVEYLKGKRSICDHMQETVNYIQHLQNKIQDLSSKRDELKRRFGEDSESGTLETLQSSKSDSVVVEARSGGFQVILDTAAHHRLPLSNLLKTLLEERLEIVSCISTKINDRFLHTVESEAVDVGSIDVVELQNKLANLEYFPLD